MCNRWLRDVRHNSARLDEPLEPMTGLVVVRLALLRLRVGEHRVLYRELADEANARYLVARVIDRRDLHRAIDKL